MALITPGPMIGEASGRIGGTIFSHNRGGMYVRNGVIPTKVTSPYTDEVRNVLTSCARSWASISDSERQAWREYCVDHPVVNRLGQKKTLSGHMAFNAVNARLLQSGDSIIHVPSIAAAPAPLTSLSLVVDTTPGSAVLTILPTPIGANNRLWTWAVAIGSPGVGYYANKWRLVNKSAKNQATALDIWSDLEDRFGEIDLGTRVLIRCQVLDTLTGLVSGFVEAVAVAT